MKKLIICILLSALLAVSLVSASELGEELVTCGEFDCATPDDFWSNLGTGGCQNKWYEQSDILRINCVSGGSGNGNTSQDIQFKAGRSYNVTLAIRSMDRTSNNITIFISDNVTTFKGIITIASNTIKSWIATPTVDGNLTINGEYNFAFRSQNQLNSISVKEIIEAPTIFIRHNNIDIQIPYTYFERKENNAWVINLPKVLFKRFVRWIKG